VTVLDACPPRPRKTLPPQAPQSAAAFSSWHPEQLIPPLRNGLASLSFLLAAAAKGLDSILVAYGPRLLGTEAALGALTVSRGKECRCEPGRQVPLPT
jgi:hypothetical protein